MSFLIAVKTLDGETEYRFVMLVFRSVHKSVIRPGTKALQVLLLTIGHTKAKEDDKAENRFHGVKITICRRFY